MAGGVAAALAATAHGLEVVMSRLHPIEWNAGEAAGHLAAFCSQRRVPPRAVRDRPALLDSFQRALDAAGIEREWPR